MTINIAPDEYVIKAAAGRVSARETKRERRRSEQEQDRASPPPAQGDAVSHLLAKPAPRAPIALGEALRCLAVGQYGRCFSCPARLPAVRLHDQLQTIDCISSVAAARARAS